MTLKHSKLFVFATVALLLTAGLLYGCLPSKTVLPPVTATYTTSEKGFPVFAAGDIADCRNLNALESGAATTASLISERLFPGERYAVLALGDTTYPVGLPAEYANCYEPTWGRFRESTFPTPGNHEYYSPSAFGYYAYFGDNAGPARRGYYSFDIDKWHIVSINSNLQPAAHASQLAWLNDDLKRHKSSCILAFWHHPLFSSGGHGNNGKMKDVWQALQIARADIVLAGHDHNYERFALQDADGNRDEGGIRQFVIGTGGAKLTPFLWQSGNSEISYNQTHGVLKLMLRSDSYEWEFISAAGSGFSDRGAARCNPK